MKQQVLVKEQIENDMYKVLHKYGLKAKEGAAILKEMSVYDDDILYSRENVKRLKKAIKEFENGECVELTAQEMRSLEK